MNNYFAPPHQNDQASKMAELNGEEATLKAEVEQKTSQVLEIQADKDLLVEELAEVKQRMEGEQLYDIRCVPPSLMTARFPLSGMEGEQLYGIRGMPHSLLTALYPVSGFLFLRVNLPDQRSWRLNCCKISRKSFNVCYPGF